MKSNFFKRVLAFIVDYLVLSLVLSIVTLGFNTNSDLTTKVNNLVNDYANSKITLEEYNNEVMTLNYQMQKNNLPVNIISVVLTIGYFIIFNYLNKGQTLGKKLVKLKVVQKDKEPSIMAIILRGVFIYGIISGLYNVIFVNFLDAKAFGYGTSIISYIESLFIIVSFFMVLYRKDKRGLHDMMAGTRVEEVR